MSHHIEHIEISNFKSIRHATIEGCKRINVFIGYPNVGKSAILEAMSGLSYLQKDYTESFSKLCRVNGASEIFHNGNYQEQTSTSINKNIRVGLKYLHETTLDCGVEVFQQNINTWLLVSNLRFHDKRVEDLTKYIPEKSIGLESVVVKQYKFPHNGHYNNHKTNGLTLFNPHGENLVDILQSHKELRKEISQMFRAYNLNLSIDQGNNSLKALKHLEDEAIYLIPFYQMADTLQRLIFHKAAIMSNQNSVLLFEEPEAHMFPPYIRKFTKDIVFDKERNNQFFIATHSPLVVSDFLEDAREDLAIHLVGLKNGETTIKTLTEAEVTEVYEYGVDLFFNIESYLE